MHNCACLCSSSMYTETLRPHTHAHKHTHTCVYVHHQRHDRGFLYKPLASPSPDLASFQTGILIGCRSSDCWPSVRAVNHYMLMWTDGLFPLASVFIKALIWRERTCWSNISNFPVIIISVGSLAFQQSLGGGSGCICCVIIHSLD